MTSLPIRTLLWLVLALLLAVPAVQAQDASVFPLPADLYILTSEHRVLRIDAVTGGQTPVSPEGQPVATFDLAPGGAWYAYRTLDNHAVIVGALNNMSGFVVEFDQPLPPGDTAQGIAWSPDAARLAYTVPQGVRIADLSTYGIDPFTVSEVQGGPWIDLYWADAGTLIALSADASSTRISGGPGAWRAEPNPEPPARRLPVEATLDPEGVRLADGRVVPGTAGALAFAWGPLPLPSLPADVLPADLAFLAPDASGVTQVWVLPAGGAPARAVTSSPQPVLDYAVAAGRVATVTADTLAVGSLDGGAAQTLATLITERVRPSVAFNADASRVAFSDQRGLWIVPSDGSEPPRQVIANVLDDQNVIAIRVYMRPQWSADETRLLVTIGLYEGSYPGVVDLADGSVTELPGSVAGEAQWTVDGRVASTSASFGYSTPGLYVLDPATPDAAPVTLLGTDHPVFDAMQAPDGTWYVVVGSNAGMGPQWMRLLSGSAPGAFAPLFGEAGAVLDAPELAPAAGAAPRLVGGLRNTTYTPDGIEGELVVADLSSGEVWVAPAPAPARAPGWVR